MDIRPTPDKDAFEVWVGDKCAVYWKSREGRWWVFQGTYGRWRHRMIMGVEVGGPLSAQVKALELLGVA